MIYLASPYTHPDPVVREDRFHIVCRAAGHFMAKGHKIFSPIAHTHPICVAKELPFEFGFWAELDKEMIRLCDEFWILQMDGWRESKGIAAELDYANSLGKPVKYV